MFNADLWTGASLNMEDSNSSYLVYYFIQSNILVEKPKKLQKYNPEIA